MSLEAAGEVQRYLAWARPFVDEELRRHVPQGSRYGEILYDIVTDHALARGKGLRPALCIAACGALGGGLEAALPSAAALELYHHAFLIHDDIEDGSLERHHRPTVHRVHGVPIALNVGDAILALALGPLLENTRVVGAGRALRILQAVARMARESAEGQALELHWVRSGQLAASDDEYLEMVEKKTSWYSFITPLHLGALAAQADAEQVAAVGEIGRCLGIAFQIRDDVLNLMPDADRYGKEALGDLWEGKYTLMLLHAVRHSTDEEQARARDIVGRPREARSEADVAFLHGLILRHASLEHAQGIALGFAARAREALDRLVADARVAPSHHLRFIRLLIDFAVEREL